MPVPVQATRGIQNMSRFEPMTRVVMLPPTEVEAHGLLRHQPSLTLKEAMALLNSEYENAEVWTNNQYNVLVRRHSVYTHLSIRRCDGGAIFRDWRHFQEIKNQIVGTENEAVELYPAESRLVDTSNSYHLFVSNDPTFRFPFGWTQRNVTNGQGNSPCPPGFTQRPRPTT